MQLGNIFPTKRRDNPNQGRVYHPEGLSPSINTNGGGNRLPYVALEDDNEVAVRSYTPLECFRLMGFTDEDFYKVQAALIERFYNGKDRANTQLYRMAGNSVIVPMLEYLYCELFDSENQLWI